MFLVERTPCAFGACNRVFRESARFAILRSGVRSPLGPPKKKAAERLPFSLVELRRGENPRFEHKDFFCACKSAAQRRVGGAGQIRSVTERSGVSPLGPPKKKTAAGLSFSLVIQDAVRTPGSNTRISFAQAKAPRSGGTAPPAKSEVSRSVAEYPPWVHQRKRQPKGCLFLWWSLDAVRTPGSNTRISFAQAKAPRSGGSAPPAKSEVSRSEAEYPPLGAPKQNPNHIFSIGDGFGFCFICFFVLPACFFLQNDKQSR